MTDVYVAGSITHMPKEWWSIYEKIGRTINNFGLTAYIPHIQTPQDIGSPIDVVLASTDDNDGFHKDIFHNDVKCVENAKLIIAEVSNPSTGTGIELGVALKAEKPIICLARKNALVTPFIMGAAQSGLVRLIRYESEEDALMQLRYILENNFSHLIVK